MPLYDVQRTPIDETTVFEFLIIDPGRDLINNIRIYNTGMDGLPGSPIGELYPQAYTDQRYWDPEQSENAEVIRRINAGTVRRMYKLGSSTYGFGTPEEYTPQHWYLETLHPFHEDHEKPHLFFSALVHSDYKAKTDVSPAEFLVPGRIVDGRRTFYKRDNSNSLSRPLIRPAQEGTDAALLTTFAAEGWYPNPPIGHEYLHAMDVVNNGDNLILDDPRRVSRAMDSAVRIRRIARAYYAWTDTVSPSVKSGTPYQTIDEDFTMKIGRSWDLRDVSSIDIKRTISSGGFSISGTDMEDWFVGNMEYWLDRGLDVLLTMINTAQFRHHHTERDFILIGDDGNPTELLVNERTEGAPTQSQWNTWKSTDYNAALGTIVTVAQGSQHIMPPSVTTATLTATVHVLNGEGATTYLWERVSGEGGSLSADNVLSPVFTKPTLEAGDPDRDIVFRLTVTNNGESDSTEATIRVEAPESTP